VAVVPYIGQALFFLLPSHWSRLDGHLTTSAAVSVSPDNIVRVHTGRLIVRRFQGIDVVFRVKVTPALAPVARAAAPQPPRDGPRSPQPDAAPAPAEPVSVVPPRTPSAPVVDLSWVDQPAVAPTTPSRVAVSLASLGKSEIHSPSRASIDALGRGGQGREASGTSPGDAAPTGRTRLTIQGFVPNPAVARATIEVQRRNSPPLRGVVEVHAAAGGIVALDGNRVGEVPPGGCLVLEGVSVGPHAIALGATTRTVEVSADQTAKVMFKRDEGSQP
jgi:hypothetical protein